MARKESIVSKRIFLLLVSERHRKYPMALLLSLSLTKFTERLSKLPAQSGSRKAKLQLNTNRSSLKDSNITNSFRVSAGKRAGRTQSPCSFFYSKFHRPGGHPDRAPLGLRGWITPTP